MENSGGDGGQRKEKEGTRLEGLCCKLSIAELKDLYLAKVP